MHDELAVRSTLLGVVFAVATAVSPAALADAYTDARADLVAALMKDPRRGLGHCLFARLVRDGTRGGLRCGRWRSRRLPCRVQTPHLGPQEWV